MQYAFGGISTSVGEAVQRLQLTFFHRLFGSSSNRWVVDPDQVFMPLPIELDVLFAGVPQQFRDAAQQVASRMPLVHVVCENANFVEMLLSPPSQLKVTNAGDSRPATLESEGLMEWEPNVYFYVGRTFHPGAVALLFAAAYEHDRDGGFTPFDSGGMIHGHICCSLARNDTAARVRYCRDCQGALRDCRETLAKFLAIYFSSLSDYLDGQPCRSHSLGIYPDPNDGGRFPFGVNNWRAWTFEIRFTSPVSIWDAMKWSPSKTQWELFLRRFENALPAEQAALLEFKQRSLAQEGSLNYRALAEAEVRKMTGL